MGEECLPCDTKNGEMGEKWSEIVATAATDRLAFLASALAENFG